MKGHALLYASIKDIILQFGHFLDSCINKSASS